MKDILTELIGFLGQGYKLPQAFFETGTNECDLAYLVIDCHSNKLSFIQGSLLDDVGVDQEQFKKGNIDLWLSLIHPEDMERVLAEHVAFMHANFEHDQLRPGQRDNKIIVEYRFRKKDGKWLWIRETKILLAHQQRDHAIKAIGKMTDITAIKNEHQSSLKEFREKKEPHNPLVKAWAKTVDSKSKINLIQQDHTRAGDLPGNLGLLTKREKEVLKYIAQGLSTKQISDKLFISDNTVETHRRHLLEKLKAKNSVELVNQVAKLAWL